MLSKGILIGRMPGQVPPASRHFAIYFTFYRAAGAKGRGMLEINWCVRRVVLCVFSLLVVKI